MSQLKFKCHKCEKQSSFKNSVDDGIRRAFPDRESQKLEFYCEHCGATNKIEISSETVNQILSQYFKDGGDLGGLIDQFLK